MKLPCGIAIQIAWESLANATWASAPPVPSADQPELFVGNGYRLLLNALTTTDEYVDPNESTGEPGLLVAFEGRIDNRAEIAQRTGELDLLTAPDVRVLAAAYRHWGESLSGSVLGTYAFVLVDVERRRVVGGHDSLGIAKLYWHADQRFLWVSSRLELLLAMLPKTAPLSRKKLVGFMRFGRAINVYEGIETLGAGDAILGEDGHVRAIVCWRPELNERRRASEADYDEELRSLLFDAVRAALRSNGKVYAQLSGGHDSSTVCSVAGALVRAGSGPKHGLTFYSLRYPSESPAHEDAFQQAVLDEYGLDHMVVQGLLDDRLQPVLDPIPATPGGLAWRTLENETFLRDQQARVVLTGMHGDVVLGYNTVCPGRLRDYLAQYRLWDYAREFRRQLSIGWGARFLVGLSLGRHSPFDGSSTNRGFSWLASDLTAEPGRLEAEDRAVDGKNFLRAYLYRSIMAEHSIPPRMEPYLDVDFRHPLLHRPLVEFCLSVPYEEWAVGESERILLRRAMRGILPDAIRFRKGKATFPNPSRLIEGDLDRHREVEKGERLASLGLVDRRRFHEAAQRYQYGLDARDMRWALEVETWLAAEPERTIDRHRRCLDEASERARA